MNLKKSLTIAFIVIVLLMIIIIAFRLSFSGIYLASWVFALLFGAATTHFFRFGAVKRAKILGGSYSKDNYYSGFNLILLLVIAAGFAFLVKSLIIDRAFNVIHVSVILYGTGLLVGNNFKGFEY